ncbi:porin [Duganella sp. FT80W]|uniref:Porin n=1 Tax=Duganella guangzhouensis TaxID=2666084 RepID=A0A6I2L5U9_9BURK|nr:porin [Duganella guangzhouensis]MRW91669.1 porin [Duganella guangzhouensis]
MKRTAASAACLAALALITGHAAAQSSVTIYGTLDVGLDRVDKSQGNVQGTVFGSSGGVAVPNSVAAPASVTSRLSPSHTRQSNIGFKGVEDLGSGWRGLFVLEGGITIDNGGLANDNRLFGRQAYVGLTTPGGEVKLGRQASPMLISYYLVTPEALGSTDLFGAGLVLNTVQTWQDNQVSYAIKQGPITAILSYATNAGIGSGISAARSVATSSTPVATASTGQIVGGLTAGAETASGRGKAAGAMLAYRTEELVALASYHRNNFDNVPIGVVSGTTLVPLFYGEKFSSYMGAVKYTIPGVGTSIAVAGHEAKFSLRGPIDPKVRTWTATLKHPIGAFDLSLILLDARFTNYTEGKDRGAMLGLDYNFSKRTALYSRFGGIKDTRGKTVVSSATPLPLSGGPGAILIPLGTQEVPLFSGAGQNIDARTTMLSLGIRHSF